MNAELYNTILGEGRLLPANEAIWEFFSLQEDNEPIRTAMRTRYWSEKNVVLNLGHPKRSSDFNLYKIHVW